MSSDHVGVESNLQPTRPTTGLRLPLSFDFNPRSFVVPCPVSQEPSSGYHASLDAIFVPTRGRPEHVSKLLQELCPERASTPVFLLPTSDNDCTTVIAESLPGVQCLSLDDREFMGAVQSLRCARNPLCGGPGMSWDLPTKRNYALWYARRHGLRQILLLDDDIRQITTSILQQGSSALNRFSLCGLFVDDFPDTSVTGHVEIVLGETVFTFLSGNSLFLRADAELGCFPPIYNEDWIFMTPHLLKRQVTVIGNIQQEPYDPFSDSSLAAIQEPGEIIADGLFALLHAHAYDRRFDRNIWRELLGMRRKWLANLGKRVSCGEHRAAVAMALCRCESIGECDCIQFIEDWEKDCAMWNSILRG